MTYSDRFTAAFELANHLHRDQRRKGSDVPYMTHLMGVASLVGEFGGGEDQMIAALLHDAVEDQGGHSTLERIRSRFGDTVAGYVEGCTDAYTEPKPPWESRMISVTCGRFSARSSSRLVSPRRARSRPASQGSIGPRESGSESSGMR